MQPQIQQKLKAIIVEHGTSIVNDPRRIKAMLKDYFPQQKKEVRVLSAVLDEGFAKRLLRDGDKIPTSISIPQYAQILHDDIGTDLALAKWAVETWAMALSLKMPQATPAPTLPPTQAPTPEPTDAWMQRLWDWADKNRISSSAIPRDSAKLSNLTYLRLGGNKLTSLPPEIGQLTNLTRLELYGNQLTTLPPELFKLTNLTSLSLGGNQLPNLPPELFKLTNLTQLHLWDNKLTRLPPEIAQLTNLKWLYLWRNQLTSLPPEIGKLTNLTGLYLWRNQLTSLPPEIGKLTNLTWLSPWYNQLTSLPPEICNLTNLRELNLSGNPLLTKKAGGFLGFGATRPEIDKIKRLLPNCEVKF